jgi:NAD(P)-dependent dehydrogenase (short-subunit alcohol dehydrogenase family)
MDVAVVTGAGSGIGRACARLLAERGLHVIAVGRRRVPLDETVASLPSGTSAQAVSADISTDAGIDAVVEAVPGGDLAAVVHSAGRESVATLAESDRDAVEEVFAANAIGPFLLTRALAERLREGAGIVFVASIAALRGRDRHAAYGGSKAALLGLTYNLAVELAPRVRVNCVCPGPVQTPMLEQFLAEYAGLSPSEATLNTLQVEAGRVPLQRIADPGEVARVAAHLALDASATTGAVVPVDLGYLAR